MIILFLIFRYFTQTLITVDLYSTPYPNLGLF